MPCALWVLTDGQMKYSCVVGFGVAVAADDRNATLTMPVASQPTPPQGAGTVTESCLLL